MVNKYYCIMNEINVYIISPEDLLLPYKRHISRLEMLFLTQNLPQLLIFGSGGSCLGDNNSKSSDGNGSKNVEGSISSTGSDNRSANRGAYYILN